MENNELTERQRDPEEIELLKKLRVKLFSDNISKARLAAFNLSWKQEDGMAILSEALFGSYERTTKKAAAYGLRSMKGRMTKLAMQVLEKGLTHRDRTTKAACIKSLALMKGETPPKPAPRRNTSSARPGPSPRSRPRVSHVSNRYGSSSRRRDRMQ